MAMPIDFGFIPATSDPDKSWRLDIPFSEADRAFAASPGNA